MKWYIVCFCFIMLGSCAAQKNAMLSEVNEINKSTAIEDSVIENLRKQNDILLIAATVNTAWVKSTSCHILAKKGNDWKGISYFKNQMPNRNQPDVINNVPVNVQTCDSLLELIGNKKAWTIPGDEGKDFCADKKCMIYDAATKQLMIATASGFSSAFYYAPEYFEECCAGNPQRALFVLITGKINAMFQTADHNAAM